MVTGITKISKMRLLKGHQLKSLKVTDGPGVTVRKQTENRIHLALLNGILQVIIIPAKYQGGGGQPTRGARIVLTLQVASR